jgi:hypothetical protein
MGSMKSLAESARNWLFAKVDLASRLANGECGGSYGDAVLVLSSIVSGIAAELWPGEGIDRKRFVEVWARYSTPELNPNKISLPLLVDTLRKRGETSVAERVRLLREDCISSIPAFDTIVVTGDRVDVSEVELLRVAPELTLADVRAQTYGSIFYRHFRSSYVHEYKAGTHGDEVVMSRTRGDITYSNWVSPPYRRINFSAVWLAEIVRSICANAAQEYWDGEKPRPNAWWLETK